MSKAGRTHALWLIVLALIILPPLGLLMLWRSPWTVRAKIAISAACLLLVAVSFGIYGRIAGSAVPACGYDVKQDGRGHYRTSRILPFEYEVFGAVVREMREFRPVEVGLGADARTARTKACDTVAAQYDLDYNDVEAIYMKVSSELARRRK